MALLNLLHTLDVQQTSVKLNSCCRKLKIKIWWIDNKATVIIGEAPCNATNLHKAFFNHRIKCLKVHEEGLSLQETFLKLQNMD